MAKKDDMDKVTTGEFAGYCPSCYLMTGDMDKQGQRFVCARCATESKPSELLADSPQTGLPA